MTRPADNRNLPIESVDFKVAGIHLNSPLRIANEYYSSSKTAFVRIKAGPFEGIGEAAPDREVTGEDTESVVDFIEKARPHLTGKNALDINGINRILDSLSKRDNTAKAGLDIALYDLMGKYLKKNVVSILGGRGKSKLTSITIGIEDESTTLKYAKKYRDSGFKVIKLKVGLDLEKDIIRLVKVREAVGRSIVLGVDANQGYTVQEAMSFASKAEPLRIAFLEQPVNARNFHGLKKVKESSGIPVMADESIKTINDLRKLASIKAVSMINIKLMKTGGITKAMQIAKEAEKSGIGVMVGCMEESRVGISAGTHLSISIKDIGFADLDAHLTHRNRFVASGLRTVQGRNILTGGYGLGIKTNFRF